MHLTNYDIIRLLVLHVGFSILSTEWNIMKLKAPNLEDKTKQSIENLKDYLFMLKKGKIQSIYNYLYGIIFIFNIVSFYYIYRILKFLFPKVKNTKT